MSNRKFIGNENDAFQRCVGRTVAKVEFHQRQWEDGTWVERRMVFDDGSVLKLFSNGAFSWSSAAEIAADEPVAPRAAETPQAKLLPMRDAAEFALRAATDNLLTVLLELPDRYGDKHTIDRRIAIAAVQKMKGDALRSVDAAILNAQPSALPPSEAAPQWLPIASAPTDGTEVYVYAAEREGLPPFITTAAYHPDAGWCVDELRKVTHWMPRTSTSGNITPLAGEAAPQTEEQPKGAKNYNLREAALHRRAQMAESELEKLRIRHRDLQEAHDAALHRLDLAIEAREKYALALRSSRTPPAAKAPDYITILHRAQKHVRESVLWKRFIDGTPLENDIAVWMADFALAVVKDCAGALRDYQQHLAAEPRTPPAADRSRWMLEGRIAQIRNELDGGAPTLEELQAELANLMPRTPPAETPEQP
jgi:hypothetical protein